MVLLLPDERGLIDAAATHEAMPLATWMRRVCMMAAREHAQRSVGAR